MKPAREADGGATELGRLFEEAIRCLKSTDLPGANAALKKAHAEAAFGRNAAGPRKTANGSEDRG